MKFSIRPEILNKIRDEQGLSSDEQLATHLGLTLGTIHGIRKGRTPSLPTFIIITRAANVDSMSSAITASAADSSAA